MSKDCFSRMVDNWPSSIVANSKVIEFSGGTISGKYLQNLASLGEPVPESIKIGNKRAWDAESLADWLRNRSNGGKE